MIPQTIPEPRSPGVPQLRGLKFIEVPSPWRQRAGRHLYFIQAGDRPLIKIGIADDASKRIWNLQSGCPDELRIVALIDTDDAPEMERQYHSRFRGAHVRGEWFHLTDDLQMVIEANSIAHGRPLLYFFHPEVTSKPPTDSRSEG